MKKVEVKSLKGIYKAIAALILVVIFGTTGYMFLENMSALDALYMTIISMTTTGFREVQPLSNASRLLTMGIIIVGISLLGFVAAQVAELIFQVRFFRRYKMLKKIEGLKDHCIICGYGRMGKKIGEELSEHHVPFVIIEIKGEEHNILEESSYPFIYGDSTVDEDLISAGIERARFLIAVTSDDASNVYTVLSARTLNSKLHIVARAVGEDSCSKLEKAGANRTVAAIEIGASRIASELLHPGIIDFMDLIFKGKQFKLQIEEIMVGEKSKLIGQKLKDTPLRHELNILSVLIIRDTGDMIYNPSADIPIYRGDRLICIGELENLEELKKISNHPLEYIATRIKS